MPVANREFVGLLKSTVSGESWPLFCTKMPYGRTAAGVMHALFGAVGVVHWIKPALNNPEKTAPAG